MVYVTYIRGTIVWPANPKSIISNASRRGIFMHPSPRTDQTAELLNVSDCKFDLHQLIRYYLYMIFPPSIDNSKCVMVHCVQRIIMVLVFSPKLSGSFSYLTLLEHRSFKNESIENKNVYRAERNVLKHFLLPAADSKMRKKNLASHFVALSHCLVYYCVMDCPPLPPLGEENMFSSSLWQEGIVKVK